MELFLRADFGLTMLFSLIFSIKTQLNGGIVNLIDSMMRFLSMVYGST
jgi:hypothetical protein